MAELKRTPLYKRYALSMLALAFMFTYLDRGLLALLLQPIKEELHLSDSQLGVLNGIAFALFYATLGIPIARWADRGNRPTITAIATGLWGLTVMLCMFVTTFPQLLAARIAAAVGEAGCMPPTYSLLGDYFPRPAERTRAMAVYMSGGPLSSLVSFVFGGWLNERYGWRTAFVVAGIPALLIAALIKLTITEPREFAKREPVEERPRTRMVELLRALWRQRSARHLILGFVLFSTLAQGLNPWYAAFMIRSHGMHTTELGVWLGLIFGLGGICGILLGGHVAARWFADNEAGQMRVSAVAVALLAPFFVLFLCLPGKYAALVALVPLILAFNFIFGPLLALMQRLVADEVRATTLALMMLLANLIGIGVGPQIVGALSDLLLPFVGADSLRYAMLMMSLVALWAALHFWRVARTVKLDLEAPVLLTRPNVEASSVVIGKSFLEEISG